MPDVVKGHWPLVVVGGLVLLNIVLIGFLLRPRDAVNAAAVRSARLESPPSANISPTQSPFPTPSPSAAQTPKSTKPVQRISVPTRRLLALTSDRQAWRATVGNCNTRGVIEVTNDAGKSWRKVNNPPLAPVSQLLPAGGNTLFVIGGRTGVCATADIATYSRGEAWIGRQGYLRQSWYRTPSNRNQVRAPGGDRSRPCQAALADFAAVDNGRAMALCTDGSLLVSRNAGLKWVKLGTLPGAVALGADNRSYVVARITAPCTGVTLNLLGANARTVSGRTRCAPVGHPLPGQVAVARRGQIVWVWAGNKTAVSTYGGKFLVVRGPS